MKESLFSSRAKPLWSALPRQYNTYFWFKAKLDAGKPGGRTAFRIASTAPYQLYINGEFAGCGPWRGTHRILWTAEHRIGAFLKERENEILLLMHDYFWPSGTRDLIEPWWIGEVIGRKGGREKALLSSESSRWKCAPADSFETETLASSYLRDFTEVYRASQEAAIHPYPGKDIPWQNAVEYPDHVLKLTEIKRTKSAPPLGDRIAPAAFKCRSLKAIPLWSKDFCEEWKEGIWRRWQQSLGDWTIHLKPIPCSMPALRYYPPDGNKISFRKASFWRKWKGPVGIEGPEKNHALIFDFGSMASGLWELSIETESPCKVHILHSEQLNDDGSLRHDLVDADMISFPAGKFKWRSFNPHGCRYALLVIEDEGALRKIDFAVRSTMYEPKRIKKLKASGTFLKKAHRACIATISRCLTEGITDGPWRERAQWPGDSLLIAEMADDLFGEGGYWERLLQCLAKASVDGDFLPAVLPGACLDKVPICDLWVPLSALRFSRKYYKKPPAWISKLVFQRVRSFYRYLSPFGLLENVPQRHFLEWTVEKPLPPLSPAMMEKWIKMRRMPEGDVATYDFMEPRRKKIPLEKKKSAVNYPAFDFLQPRTRGINAPFNALWILSLEAGIEMARRAGAADVEREFSNLRKKAVKSFYELFFDASAGLVKDRIPSLPHVFAPSEHSNYCALFAGILPKKDAERVIKNCLNPKRKMMRILSPYGARYVVGGFLNYGKRELAYRYLKTIYEPMLKRGQTLWEDFGGASSRNHGYGAYPIWMYLKTVKALRTFSGKMNGNFFSLKNEGVKNGNGNIFSGRKKG